MTVGTLTTTDAGGSALLGSGVQTDTFQKYQGDVTLAAGANAVLTGSDITFAKTLKGNGDLTLTATTGITFGGAVGGTIDPDNPLVSATDGLKSLNVTAGPVLLTAPSVATTGGQHYGDAVTLAGAGGPKTLVTGTGNLKVDGAITGAAGSDLRLNSGGRVDINKNITAEKVLVKGVGGVQFGPLVTVAANSQTYRGGTGDGTANTAAADLRTNDPQFRAFTGTNRRLHPPAGPRHRRPRPRHPHAVRPVRAGPVEIFDPLRRRQRRGHQRGRDRRPRAAGRRADPAAGQG